MQMKFVAKIAINLELILTSELFASAENQPAQGPPSPTAVAVPAAQPGSVWSPAQNIDMFALPKTARAPTQQLKDESECYGAAK